MEQIADAPWIREAENDGWQADAGPFPANEVQADIWDADSYIEKAQKFLTDAWEACDGEWAYRDELNNILTAIKEAREDMKQLAIRIEKNDWR